MIEISLFTKRPMRVGYRDAERASRHNPPFRGWFPTERCVRATNRAEFSGECTPGGSLSKVSREASGSPEHHWAWGLGMSGMEKVSEPLTKRRQEDLAKVADRPRPKWCEGRTGGGVFPQRGCCPSGAKVAPNPTRSVEVNLRTLSIAPLGESEPRGEPMGGQREDRRGSECRAVMGRIGPVLPEIPSPLAFAGGVQTSAWCGWTRELVRSLEGVS